MSKRISDLIAGLFSILVAVIFLLGGQKLAEDSKRFPGVLEWFLIFCGLLLIARAIFVKQSERVEEKDAIDWVRASVIMVGSILYVICLNFIGFYVSSVIYLALGSWYLNEHGFKLRPLISSIAFGVLLSAVLYGTFSVFLHVYTPKGFFF